jgi:hypothetical protein
VSSVASGRLTWIKVWLFPPFLPKMHFPKPVWLATHGIYYTRMRLQNPIYIASPGREILIFCYNDLTGPLNSRHHAEDAKAIHSNNSFPFVPKDQLLGRFQFMYVTVVFRTEQKSTNFKNWLRFKQPSSRIQQKYFFRLHNQVQRRLTWQIDNDVTSCKIRKLL